MDFDKYILKLESPSAEEFLTLRNKVGWEGTDLGVAKSSLNNTLFHVVIRHQSQLIGMGRVVGDGAMYFYIQDIVVDPEYQNLGIGSALMEQIESYLASATENGATIGLLAAKGKESFYKRYDYIQRPSNSLGHGMCRFVRN